MNANTINIPAVSNVIRETRLRGDARRITADYGVKKVRHVQDWAGSARTSPFGAWWNRLIHLLNNSPERARAEKHLRAESDKTALALVARSLFVLLLMRFPHWTPNLSARERQSCILRCQRGFTQLLEFEFEALNDRQKLARLLIFIWINFSKLLLCWVSEPKTETLQR